MKGLPRLLRNTEGTAFAEALVCLPLFAAALAVLVAFNSMYTAKLEAKSRARRLAWLQADSGACPAQSCRTGECGRAEAAIHTGGLDEALNVRGDGLSLGSFLGNVASYLLGRATNGVGLAEAPMPHALGGGSTEQHGVTTLLCNTKPRQLSEGTNVLQHACAVGLRSAEYANEVCR